ncbi:response regulator [Polaromonas sp. C04]|uniref:response regulator n=1 Tax=Polaromonas sp. C04 TaxID=1945857 RepID=UPI000984493C|nr:response regulator [Polaromonas sp. C04]OOG57978.1 hypothetical protein B0E49_03805 [Polaromonas sp. C04]
MSSSDRQSIVLAKILIAEDSPTQAQRLRYFLEQQGYEVRVVGNGRLALAEAAQFRPGLLISDVVMPEMDGYDLTRRFKADPALARIPVILVTTMSDPDDVIRGLACGADGFILKPYEERYLLGRVQYMLLNHEFGATENSGMGVEIFFNGQRHYITAGRLQILNLLLSTYDAAIQRNKELGQIRDTLERRSAEVAAANLFLDSVIENMPNLVFIKDAVDLRYVRWNRAGEALLGHARDAVVGKRDRDIYPRELADHFTAQDREVLTHGTALDIREEAVQTRDKGIRMLHTKKVLVPDGLGRPGHLLGISEDVTEQREMEREIRKLNTELQERAKHLEAVNKDLESFSYSASHDLRSPLSVIGGYVGLLEKRYAGQLDQTGLEYLSTIRSNVKLMSQLIYDLLAFSRCSQQTIASADLDMNQLVHGVVQEVLQGYPVGKTPRLSVGPLPPASADPGLLRQVWMNLLSNAVKYSGKSPNPEIEVSGRTEGGEIVYSVQDNGAGFSMEHYPKLFEVFERLHGAGEFEGSGVGLAIVHRVVTRHGGRVWAQSKPHAGAVFHFSLPAGRS